MLGLLAAAVFTFPAIADDAAINSAQSTVRAQLEAFQSGDDAGAYSRRRAEYPADLFQARTLSCEWSARANPRGAPAAIIRLSAPARATAQVPSSSVWN